MTGGAREFEAMPTPVHTATLYNKFLIRWLWMKMIMMIITTIIIKITIIVQTSVHTLYDNLLIRMLNAHDEEDYQKHPESRCSSGKCSVSFKITLTLRITVTLRPTPHSGMGKR